MRSTLFAAIIVLFLTLAALVTGCGIKGGLYYPPPPKAPPSSSQSAPVETSTPLVDAQSTPATSTQ